MRLFEDAREKGLTVGEVTPTYAILQEEVFRYIYALNNEVKVAFIMRDPVGRVWSEVNKALNQRLKGGAFTVATALQNAHRPGIVQSSAYLDTLQRLDAVFPPAQLYYGFFDDLREQPKFFAANLSTFLGVDPGGLGTLPGPVNVAAGQSVIPDAFARPMAKEYLPMVRALCERFEGPPQQWLTCYEKLLEAGSHEV
jgi:hypothetical protein